MGREGDGAVHGVESTSSETRFMDRTGDRYRLLGTKSTTLECWNDGDDGAIRIEPHFINARFAMVPIPAWDRPAVIHDVIVAIGQSQYRIVARGLNAQACV